MKAIDKWTRPTGYILRWMHVFDHIDKSKKILDFGSGAGYSLFVGRRLGYDIVGLDVKDEIENYLSIFKRLRTALETDVYTVLYNTPILPFEDDSFDIIICRAVLSMTYQHINIQEFKRVLKDDGIILVLPESHLRFLKDIPEKNKGVLYWGGKDCHPSDEELYSKLCSNAKERIEGIT
jgi:SAM-dependent methyltransferase